MLTHEQKENRLKIITHCFEHKQSHLGSCLSAVDIIDAIYTVKKAEDFFVLSSGHAGIAWYFILKKYGFLKSVEISSMHFHPDRKVEHGIHVSTGSLGQGLPIALGMALANKKNRVYCLVSDGECAEGSIWESLKIAVEHKITNLVIIFNVNGYGAYSKIKGTKLLRFIKGFLPDTTVVDGHNMKALLRVMKKESRGKYPKAIFAKTTPEQLPGLTGQHAHYTVVSKKDLDDAVRLYS